MIHPAPLLVAAGFLLAGAVAPPATKAIGPVRGAVSDYQVTVTVKADGRAREGGRPFSVRTFRPPAGSDLVAVALAEPEACPLDGGLPLLIYRLDRDGKALPDPRQDRDVLRTLLSQALFAGAPETAAASGSRWKETCSAPGLLALDGVIEHRVDRGGGMAGGRPGTIVVTSQRVRSSDPMEGLRSIEIRDWGREIVADEATGRPLSTTLTVEFEPKGGADAARGGAGRIEYRIEAEETSRRPLDAAEAGTVAAEIEQLRTVLEAAGRRRGAPPADTYAIASRPAGRPDPLALLDAYEGDHPRGILLPAAARLRSALARVAASPEAGTGRREAAPPPDDSTVPGPDGGGAVRGGAEHGEKASLVGRPAPGFKLEDLEGKAVSLGDLEGKPVLLVFWGVGCGPCRAEAPHLSDWQERFRGRGLVVLAVNGYDEPKEVVEKFMRENRLKQRILLKGRSVARTYGVRGFPTAFFIDRRGTVVDQEMGFTKAREDTYLKKIASLLRE